MSPFRVVFCAIVLLVVPWTAVAQPGTPATSVVGYPGAGVIQAGDTWESFLPQCFGPNYQESSTASTLGVTHLLHIGNFDRNWTTPGTHWPAAFPVTPYWNRNVFALVFDPDTTWNRATISGQPNYSFYDLAAGGTGAQFSNFANLTYRSTLNGANDPARKYSIEPYFVDGTRRQHVVYEAAWPTNVGIDVKVRAHGFAAPNWNNLNDFVLIEVQLKNTGFLDMDMNGVAEQIGHDIKAITLQIEGQTYMSVSSYGTGARINDIVSTAIARQAGWVDDPDPAGSPWAFSMVFPSATTYDPAAGAGNIDLGFNGGTTKPYTDIHHGWVMIDVKSGGLPADRTQSSAGLNSKETIFGTHPIGTGGERGWYATGGSSKWAGFTNDPRKMFYLSTGAFYQDGGKKSHTRSFDSLNLAANPNLFSSGTAGNPLTFVPKPVPGRTRPDGDFKSSGKFDQVSFEDGSADSATLYPDGWGKWTAGCSNTENFDGDMFSGVGPFSIPKDSTITIVFATVAGYRLEGIQRSVRAARWGYENNFQLPSTPPVPDMTVSVKSVASVSLDWDNAAQSDPEFAGYKIWRASKGDTLNYLEEGIRVVDRYQEQMSPGQRPPSVFKPVNPKFDASAKSLGTALHGQYQPDTWGTWKLLKVIPKAGLGALAGSTLPGYAYRWNDSVIVSGTSYWYYVSAFKEGTYAGPGGETTDRIETHSLNRNGASGLWVKTFPFAPANANYPKDGAGKKAIGAAIVGGTVSIRDERTIVPAAYELCQNYPNPFNPTTTIRYTIVDRQSTTIVVYDVLGREVSTLVNEVKPPGSFSVQFDASGLAGGVYFYRLSAGARVETRAMLLVK